MDRLKRAALLTRLIQALRKHGSWCGETHIQKSTLFLQNLLNVPLGYDFILYKHGPFSFDLRDELTSMRADGLTRLQPQFKYGPRIVPTDRSAYLQEVCSKTVGKYDAMIDFVAKRLGNKDVADLERLATALYITLQRRSSSAIERSRLLSELKPHIQPHLAKGAVEDADRIVTASRALTH